MGNSPTLVVKSGDNLLCSIGELYLKATWIREKMICLWFFLGDEHIMDWTLMEVDFLHNCTIESYPVSVSSSCFVHLVKQYCHKSSGKDAKLTFLRGYTGLET